VQTSNISSGGQNSLISDCAAIWRQGIRGMENLDDRLWHYRAHPEKCGVGAHFRHNLDFADSFWCGLETGKIDYHRSETAVDLWCPSSGLRELEFLQSHAIHHYALIAQRLSAVGFAVPEDSGVAPSTLEHWRGLRD
jgi:hypothetical protein